MRLWIDGQCFQTASRFRGIGRYVTDFIGGLVEARPDIEILLSLNGALREEAIAARALLDAVVDRRNIHVWQGLAEGGEAVVGATEGRRLSEIVLAHHVSMLNVDLALSASPFEGVDNVAVPYFPIPGNQQRSAVIFYDAIPMRFPDRYLAFGSARAYFERRIEKISRFDCALAISKFALSELKAFAPSVKGVNIEAAASPAFLALAKAAHELAPEWPRAKSVLYVGGLDWRKNVNGAAAAFEFLPRTLKEHVEFHVVGLASAPLAEEIRQTWRKAGMPPQNLKLLGHVDDVELIQLYRSAGVLIQPSFMEGFGLTALEAMVCGAPVIVSRGTAMTEVVTNPRAAFDPRKPRDIASTIARVLTDEAFVRALIAEGRRTAEAYSWKATAQTALEALTPIAQRQSDDREIARARTLVAIGAIVPHQDLTARAMAASEPSLEPGRLLIDVTATADADHGTGIQRVVNKIAASLALGAERERVGLIYGKAESGFARTAFADGKLRPPTPSESDIAFLRGDVVLMLDSSWEHHRAHAQVLPRALLQGCEVVTTLYDLVPVRTPAFCDAGMPPVFAAWLQSALSYSTAFACISRAVAEELHALLTSIAFPRPMKIGHWPLGADFGPAPTAVKAKPSAARPSFLMVGTIEPRKGHGVALSAFEKLWADGVDVELTLIGKRGWGVDAFIARLLQHGEYGHRLHWLERVSDDELSAAYAQTDALVSASYAEGFGLPIVEAGHFGKPVIASDLPVFREVAQFAGEARFFEVGNSHALAAQIAEFLAAGGLASARSTHARSVSWRESAEQLKVLALDGAWQMRYVPATPSPVAARTDLGCTTMRRTIEGAPGVLTFVEGPSIGATGQAEIVLGVLHSGDGAWSSAGADGNDRFGVVVECQRTDERGAPLDDHVTRTRFPWVVTPSLPHYVRVPLPPEATRVGGYVRLVLRQIDGGEVSAPLIIPVFSEAEPVSVEERAEGAA